MSFALKIQNSCLQTFRITSWITCSKIVVEIIHGYLQLYAFQKEASVKTEDKSAVFISLDVGLTTPRITESRGFQIFVPNL